MPWVDGVGCAVGVRAAGAWGAEAEAADPSDLEGLKTKWIVRASLELSICDDNKLSQRSVRCYG